MGWIGTLLSFAAAVRNAVNIREVKTDPGGGANTTLEHFADPGDDSHPLPDDYVAATDIPRTGGSIATGYIDVKNTPISAPGEKRIYGRDDNGSIVNSIHLFKTGKIVMTNGEGTVTLFDDGQVQLKSPLATLDLHIDGRIHGFNPNGSFILRADGRGGGTNSNGFYELRADGTFDANGATIDPSGVIRATEVFVDSKGLKDHVHDAGTPPGETGPNKV